MVRREFDDELTEPLSTMVEDFRFLPDAPEHFLISERRQGEGGDYEAVVLVLTPTELLRYTVRPRKPLSGDLYVETERFPLAEVGRIQASNRSGEDEIIVSLGEETLRLPLDLNRSDARNAPGKVTAFVETLVAFVRDASTAD